MDLKAQLIFLFSALGAFNGLVLSAYFTFFARRQRPSSYFLAALLFVLSIRIIKSVFFHFNPDLSQAFIQIGISACILIGPCLFLYVTEAMPIKSSKKQLWQLHILPFLLLICLAWFFIPYREYRRLWSVYLMRAIYLQWLAYIIFAGVHLRPLIKKAWSKSKKLEDQDFFLLSIYVGTTIIWLAYFTVRYTSYIVGALSFSFIFYLLLLLWFFKRKDSLFFEKPEKYSNKKIASEAALAIAKELDKLMMEKQLYKNPDLKLSDVARALNMSPHIVSQILNDNTGKRFSLFLNEYRIKEAQQRLVADKKLTLEAIGQECGFKSNSAFYTAFKKITGLTPAKFKKQAN